MTAMLGTSKIAARLGVSESHARAMCEQGIVPAIKLGKLWRIDEALLEEWIRKRSEQNTQQRLVVVAGGRP